jgi:type II secretory pathway pseudopilin PulG
MSSVGRLSKHGGFTYVMVLLTLVLIAISVQVMHVLTSRVTQRENENELLFRGDAYIQAIASYYHAVPGRPEYPRRLSDLENDPRFLLKRHIRRLYDEPVSGEWNLLTNAEGEIIGVASFSMLPPLKIGNFPKHFDEFTDSQHYSDWQFVFRPG